MSQDTSTNPIENSQLSSNKNRDSVVYSVEQLNIHIRQTLENQLGVIWLQAEISNFKPHSSGHFYFSLKDSKAQISAIMFRGSNSKLKFKPHDGLEVIVRGKITVYEPRGTYQIVCDTMEPVGAGALQKQFEQLKEKLKNEGLFDALRKKVLPAFPKSIAVVTSPTGAAIQDILNIMKRRAPHVSVTIVPTIVQGAAAAPAICEAFRKATLLKPDVIIIGRGGGSIEDMWCFNDETLARKISECSIPVISAVGHEIDFTICDFVADLRAPTPSAAAELVAKSSNELLQKLNQWERLIRSSFERIFRLKFQAAANASRRLVDPKKQLMDYSVRNDEMYSRLEQALKVYLSHQRKDLNLLHQRMVSPVQLMQQLKLSIDHLKSRMIFETRKNLSNSQNHIRSLMSLLDSLSPLKVVDRGFSITQKENRIVKSVKDVKAGDEIKIRVTDGFIDATVKGVQSGF
ncbi:MAG: exodeoxyribonuclease VII large subunit [Bdellovibrionales bacterium RIFCSPHIGHO2_01_FULL_40_29]|nr:MAG: exodeoxyribonuclease VII large subunit [Bdellovibrionales bacterium RIFCSPHIGHO2_01_FULL_40_29]OFZ35064.1 MAG: exodeoxyribonuclease VII large subunit [Bdellovibrionales bacterium RIFCSPHIGHO2_02_FULL_40_15]